MKQSKAIIVVENREALRAAAGSARISTQQGTALEIFDRSLGDEKDLNLLKKVLSSGHKSVIEHQTVSIAFNDVSVLVEQFVIECRLASFTVKSRRYVDFGAAGWVCPEGLTEDQRALYDAAMAARFDKTYVIDLRKNAPVYDAAFKEAFFLNGHLNPCGYIITAKMVMSYMDYIIRHNMDDFREAGLIGTPFKNVRQGDRA